MKLNVTGVSKIHEIKLFFQEVDYSFLESIYEIKATSYYQSELDEAIENDEHRDRIRYLQERLQKAKELT